MPNWVDVYSGWKHIVSLPYWLGAHLRTCTNTTDVESNSSKTKLVQKFIPSIKGQERAPRKTGDQFILDGPVIRIPNNFKLFLSNAGNKEQLWHKLKKVWIGPKTVPQLLKCLTAILIVKGKAYW